MSATPPFIIDTGSPAPSDIVSTFPSNEQANRQQLSDWLAWITDPTTGLLKTQAMSNALKALTALSPAADKVPYFTGSSTASMLDLASFIRDGQINTITTAATGVWAGRLLVLKSGAPALYLQDTTGSAQSALISVDGNILTIYSSTANDGTDLVARYTINLATGAQTVNGTLTVTG